MIGCFTYTNIIFLYVNEFRFQLNTVRFGIIGESRVYTVLYSEIKTIRGSI